MENYYECDSNNSDYDLDDKVENVLDIISLELENIIDLYNNLFNRFPFLIFNSTEFSLFILEILEKNSYFSVRHKLYVHNDSLNTIIYIINDYLSQFRKHITIYNFFIINEN